MSGLSDLLAIATRLAFSPILSLALTQSPGELHLVKEASRKSDGPEREPAEAAVTREIHADLLYG